MNKNKKKELRLKLLAIIKRFCVLFIDCLIRALWASGIFARTHIALFRGFRKMILNYILHSARLIVWFTNSSNGFETNSMFVWLYSLYSHCIEAFCIWQNLRTNKLWFISHPIELIEVLNLWFEQFWSLSLSLALSFCRSSLLSISESTKRSRLSACIHFIR